MVYNTNGHCCILNYTRVADGSAFNIICIKEVRLFHTLVKIIYRSFIVSHLN
jgi:hypothetical protein